jgi:superfamily I DNA/RNA helicase
VRGITLRQQFDEYPDDLNWVLVDRVARGLAEYKRQKHLQDFTDMVSMFADSEWNARLDVLFVDEAQDLSLLQWRVVQRLAKGCRRVVVAGDDDQAIYAWAGAAVEHFVGMPGKVQVLGQSWRVPQSVQGVAMEVINRVKQRRPKAWSPRPQAGVVRRVQSLDEIDFGTGEDVLVLARNAAFLRDDAAALLRTEGVLYSFRGAQSVKASVVDAILDWERLRRGEAITVDDAARVYEQISVGPHLTKGYKKLPGFEDREAEVTMRDLHERGGLKTEAIWHEALDRISAEDRAYMLKALRRGEKLARNPTVKLSTIHGAKGGEAQHVILLRDMAFRTYKAMETHPDDEHRCFYVAATRAMQQLTIVAPQTRRSYDI